MKRWSRLFVPFSLGAILLAMYWVLHENPSLLRIARLDAELFLRILLFLACIPLALFSVRAIDLLAFDLRRTVPAPLLLRELVSIVLYAIAFGSAISFIFNRSVTAFLATGTVVAAVLGLALQETLGNLFAGIALHMESSFAPGDVIRTGEYLGIVEAIRWRGTRLRTFNNNLVIVPNSLLARERLEVFPRNNFNARVLQINIDQHAAPATVIAVLTQAASHVEGVVQEMPCLARVAAFTDSGVTYEIKYFTADYSMRDRIDSDIRKAVWYALQRNGIELSVPIRAVKRYAPATQRLQPEPGTIRRRLSRVDILSPISRDVQQKIADAARVHVYSNGETILTHGAQGDSMFIVHDGSVSVRVDGEEVARLGPGDFFGEMALLTGERRTADVVALTDVVALEIARDALLPVLHEVPDLAAAISARVVERQSNLDSRLVRSPEEHASMLSRIKAYFGL
ncbi:MAG TPA: mechanosensitive ion channel family protein [Thermoanaerobaculia bacterium]|nr:mechanosensitive ion channel family protein [Thermoanaerobaculia bacterium]